MTIMDTCSVCGRDDCRTPGEVVHNFCRVTGTAVPNPTQRVVDLATGRTILLEAEPEPEPEDEVEPESKPEPELTRVVRTKGHKGKKRR